MTPWLGTTVVTDVSMLLQVIPSDARGQVLLAALHNLQNTSGGQNRLSPTGLDEETDSMSVHSSREDLGRKVKKNNFYPELLW